MPSLLFWNCRSIRNHNATALGDLCEEHQVLAAAFVETHHSDPTHLRNVPGYGWIGHPCTDHRSGVALLHRRAGVGVFVLPADSIIPVPVPPHAHADTGLAVVTYEVAPDRHHKFLLVVVYLPPEISIPALERAIRTISSTAQKARASNTPLFIVGDFNARHLMWDAESNFRGTKLADAFAAEQLRVVNGRDGQRVITRPSDQERYVDGPAGLEGTVIDLLVTNSPHLISSLEIKSLRTVISDHYALVVDLRLEPRNPPRALDARPPVSRWKVKRKPEKWQRELPAESDRQARAELDRLPPIDPPDDQPAAAYLQELYDRWERALVAALRATVGEAAERRRPTDKPWYVPSLRRLKADLKRATNVNNALQNDASRAHVHALRQRHNTACLAARDSGWTRACGAIENTRGHLDWKMFNRLTPKSKHDLRGFVDADGNHVPHKISLDICAAQLAESAVPPPAPPETERATRERVEALLRARAVHVSDLWEWSPDDVREGCCRTRVSSAPGPDGIHPVILRHLGPYMYELLAAIFAISWKHGVLVTQWREANVIALYKGAGDRAQASSYRPISMTSAVIRSFEHLVRAKLTAHLEQSARFSPMQFGFRGRRGTSDAIAQLMHMIRRAFELGDMLPVTFLDLRKAFDRVWPDRLLVLLDEAGVGGCVWRWLRGFLNDRRLRVVDRSVASDWHDINFGVPQGCVLSPTLFLVYIDPLAKLIERTLPGPGQLSFKALLYADDAAICLEPDSFYDPNGRNARPPPAAIHVAAQHKLALLDNWALHNRMEFNHSKCVTVVFSRHLSTNAEKVATARYLADLEFPARGALPVRKLAVADHTRYLGLILDRRLNWQQQSSTICAKAISTSHLISRVVRPAPKPSPFVIRRIVLGLLLPQITFALEHWRPNESTYRRLHGALVRPLAKTLALPYVTNHAAVLAEFAVTPLPIHRLYMLLRFLDRALQLPSQHPTRVLLSTQRQLVSDPSCNAQTRALLTDILVAEKSLEYAHDSLASPSLNGLYADAIPRHLLPPRPTLDYFVDGSLRVLGDPPPLRAPFQRPRLARAAALLGTSSWLKSPPHPTAPLNACVAAPDLPRYLARDDPESRRIRGRLRHDRAITQEYRHKCFSRDPQDRRYAADPLCLHAACRGANVHETGRHAVLDCPAVRPHAERLRADLGNTLARAVNAEDAWLFLLGCRPPDTDDATNDQVLERTATYLKMVSSARKTRNRRLMPLAYPIRLPGAADGGDEGDDDNIGAVPGANVAPVAP